eukprot:TRINITY_DN9272_c0_g2_i1.p1 TRINITY_DN9272_c0_g2~~TRINITY_DN9272_c0_g2_i1.p1  ORF type:complete len:148 (+),score=0.53 TRINITY_DN9272_c0_g2_i1:103-546(+)
MNLLCLLAHMFCKQLRMITGDAMEDNSTPFNPLKDTKTRHTVSHRPLLHGGYAWHIGRNVTFEILERSLLILTGLHPPSFFMPTFSGYPTQAQAQPQAPAQTHTTLRSISLFVSLFGVRPSPFMPTCLHASHVGPLSTLGITKWTYV